MYRDYAPKGVQFFYVYKQLAHPEKDGYVDPFSLQERLAHVKETRRNTGTKIPFLVDTMDNDLKHALGDRPNSEFVIDPKGVVASKRSWSDPEELRKDLEELVGPVENPTRVADLDLVKQPPPKPAARGVVKRLEKPNRLQVLKITPDPGDRKSPFYVKLRAEASRELLNEGKGDLYLGFFLDPLYRVHWNNKAKPIRVTFANGSVEPETLEGPKVEQDSDVDPREFLVNIEAQSDEPLELDVSYFACNNEEGWCKAVRQRYTISWEVNRDAGWQIGNRPGRANQRRRRPLANTDDAKSALGRIVAENKSSVTIMSRARKRLVFAVTGETRIDRNGRPAEKSDLEVGDLVRLRYSEEKGGKPTVLVLRARSATAGSAKAGVRNGRRNRD